MKKKLFPRCGATLKSVVSDSSHNNPDIRNLLHELQVHQIELELQNEELRQTNAYLEISKAELEAIFNTVPIGLAISNDPNCYHIRGNVINEQMLGVPPGSEISRRTPHPVIFRNTLNGLDIPVEELPMQRAVRGEKVSGQIMDVERPDGKKITLFCSATPLLNKAGEVRGAAGAFMDITELKRVEMALKASHDVLEQQVHERTIELSKTIVELKQSHDELESKVSERTADLARANEQMKKVSLELIWAEERERERIAGELHDQVGQSLLLAKIKVDTLADCVLDDSPRSYANDASALLEKSIHDIRTLTFRMRPPILDTAGIETALEWLCASVSNDYDLKVHFITDCLPKPLSVELRYSLYQVVRELLINIEKHAGTDTAQLSINTENQAVVVHITDNGIGFNYDEVCLKPICGRGYGLYNVKHRIEQMGGQFTVESSPGTGTMISLVVPLTES